MNPDSFVALQAEFETLAKRLKETRDPSKRRRLLRELRLILVKLDAAVENPPRAKSN